MVLSIMKAKRQITGSPPAELSWDNNRAWHQPQHQEARVSQFPGEHLPTHAETHPVKWVMEPTGLGDMKMSSKVNPLCTQVAWDGAPIHKLMGQFKAKSC